MIKLADAICQENFISCQSAVNVDFQNLLNQNLLPRNKTLQISLFRTPAIHWLTLPPQKKFQQLLTVVNQLSNFAVKTAK